MAGPRRFLAVAPDSKRCAALEAMLASDGAVVTSISAAQAPDALKDRGHRGIFIDADHAGTDVAALCRRLRERRPATDCSIVLFGERREGPRLAQVLDSGADDYWAYPFNSLVCLAYLRAIVRRLSRVEPHPSPLRLAGLVLDPSQRQVAVGQRTVELRSKEFDLLMVLLRHRGKALSREALMQEVWGHEYFGTTRTIDFHVSQLRQKLGSWGLQIEAVSGLGYRVRA